MRNAVARKKEAFKTFCETGLEEYKMACRKMRNQTVMYNNFECLSYDYLLCFNVYVTALLVLPLF